jgi:hypothetical protein
MYMQGQNLGGLGDVDWNALINTAVTGYAQVSQAKAASDLAQKQFDLQQAQIKQNQLIYAANPNYSAAYGGASQSSNLMPLLLIGGAALLVVFLMKG